MTLLCEEQLQLFLSCGSALQSLSQRFAECSEGQAQDCEEHENREVPNDSDSPVHERRRSDDAQSGCEKANPPIEEDGRQDDRHHQEERVLTSRAVFHGHTEQEEPCHERNRDAIPDGWWLTG
jgi:hypothetical protein